MIGKIIYLFKFKWVNKGCTHLCLLCEYRRDCNPLNILQEMKEMEKENERNN